ncbi:MAG: Sir2 family NAD-dependent protein deacetylase [Chloroflexota bacterium]
MEELISRAARDLVNSHYAIALTGAGITTESGIPDFRGPSGIWTKNPDAERRAYRSYERFLSDPKGWWEERLSGIGFLGDLSKVLPNAGHHALAELERMGILKCVITQNVDGLHEKAGTKSLLEYHGNAFKLRCATCLARFKPERFDLTRLKAEGKLPPRCPECGGVVKSDGVAFGEPIPRDVAQKSHEEALKSDLMLICGTSAVVYPFADLPRTARGKKGVVIIEVNAEPTPLTYGGISDYIIQGKTGEILPGIVEKVREVGRKP